MNIDLQSDHMMSVEWEKTSLQELDITATELSTECLMDVLCRIPALRYLSAGQQDCFTDLVLYEFMEKGNTKSLISLDLDRNENVSEEILLKFLKIQAPMLNNNLKIIRLFLPLLTIFIFNWRQIFFIGIFIKQILIILLIGSFSLNFQ